MTKTKEELRAEAIADYARICPGATEAPATFLAGWYLAAYEMLRAEYEILRSRSHDADFTVAIGGWPGDHGWVRYGDAVQPEEVTESRVPVALEAPGGGARFL